MPVLAHGPYFEKSNQMSDLVPIHNALHMPSEQLSDQAWKIDDFIQYHGSYCIIDASSEAQFHSSFADVYIELYRYVSDGYK